MRFTAEVVLRGLEHVSALRRTVKREGQSAEDVVSLSINLPEFQKTQMPRAKSTLVFRTGSLTCRISQLSLTRKSGLKVTYFY